LAFDLPGYGDSGFCQPTSTADMAAHVVESLLQLEAWPAVFLGHSMGGMVALEAAAARPDLTSALVLMCSSAAFGPPGKAWQQAFVQERLRPLDDGLGMAGLAQQLLPGLLSSHASPAAWQAARESLCAVPQATYRQALQAIASFDRRGALPELQMPVLCLSAALDVAAPPSVMARMAERLPAAQHICLPDAGHLVYLEQPQAVARTILDFLASVPASPARPAGLS
jgi:pimeloyl-ACP methyl ester carboxylesterase